MPRFSTLPASGCRPIRLITADELGYVKVVESRGQNAGPPEVVARWGDGGRGKGVERMQVTSSGPFGGLVTVARSDQTVELLDIASGQPHASFIATPLQTNGNKPSANTLNPATSQDAVRGIHLFQQPTEEAVQVLTCSRGGAVSQWKVPPREDGGAGGAASTVAEWGVGSGVESLAVDHKEQSLVVGGKGLDATLWSLETRAKLWQAKNTRPDALGLQTPVWVTQLLFLGGDGNRVLAATGHHQLRLYDVKAQRRPVMVMEYGELPIWSVAEDPSGHVVYAGNSTGDIVSFDLRTGTKSGGFPGSVSGSVRSLAVHPTEPLLASVGLDRFLRIHNTQTRQLQAKLFLKQQMVACAFDTDPARQPEEAEPPVEDEAASDDDDRPMRHVAASDSGRDDDGDLEEEEGASGRKRKSDKVGRKSEKRARSTKKHEEEEMDSDEEAWDDSDSDEEEGFGERKGGRKTEGRKTGESNQKRKKSRRNDDEDSKGEGFDGEQFGTYSDEESEEEGLPKKKRKSRSTGQSDSGRKGGRPRGKGVGVSDKRRISIGKKKSHKKRT
ncbi:hypothetical protein KFL_000590120 [Klebsormidium nitens]|uniref:Uncharacterized protein n=1 Tax=Klebsormidium nitens TaxID=105231 RepID=A0A1Y1HU02_KLENI|nr:hypothetical protein KFL_000590120 [Klebsormidium nitens]|eukprot:GAQ80659.1 hypothetical protein KFL_000590120 [Klebsormidium nitens]